MTLGDKWMDQVRRRKAVTKLILDVDSSGGQFR